MIKLYPFLYALGNTQSTTTADDDIYHNQVVVEFHLPETNITHNFIKDFESKHDLIYQGRVYNILQL